ncbi:MAG: hypothetical protein AAB439_01430 [Patescibacteria group bacterium]
MSEAAFGDLDNPLHKENRRDLRRHARRSAYEESLSPEAKEDIEDEARDTYADIMRHPLGSVFYVMPSNVERALDTRSHLEKALKELARDANEDSVEFIDYADEEMMASAVHNPSKRWVVTNVPDVPGLGLTTGNNVAEVWNEAQEDLRVMAKNEKEMAAHVHNLLSKIQVTRKSEVNQLVKEILPLVDSIYTKEDVLRYFNPTRFISESTPEDEAANQLEEFAREAKNMEDKFPDQHVHGITIAHAPVIDYITMGIIGKEINLKNWNEMGGIRNFLESAQFDFDQDGNLTSAAFRDKHLSTSAPVKVSEIIQNLRDQGKQRRVEWGLA